jgi:hypothetical protein
LAVPDPGNIDGMNLEGNTSCRCPMLRSVPDALKPEAWCGGSFAVILAAASEAITVLGLSVIEAKLRQRQHFIASRTEPFPVACQLSLKFPAGHTWRGSFLPEHERLRRTQRACRLSGRFAAG